MTSRGMCRCALLQLLLCIVLAQASPESSATLSAVDVQMRGAREGRRRLRRSISVDSESLSSESLSSDSLPNQLDAALPRLHAVGNNFADVDIKALSYATSIRKPKLTRTVEYL
jgi:hypothetical protein